MKFLLKLRQVPIIDKLSANIFNHSSQLSLLFNLTGLSLLILVLTFPYMEPDITVGFDGSYFLVINYFFAKDISLFNQIIHSYGPLSPLLFPQVVGNNFGISLIFISFLRFFEILGLLYLGRINKKPWVALFPIILLLLAFTGVDYVFYTLIINSIFLYKKTNRNLFSIIGALVASIGIFLKITIAINCFLILISFILLEYSYFKNRKAALYTVLAYVLATLIIWICIYKTYANLIDYVISWFYFSVGNTDFSILNPPNNLFLLIGSILIFFMIPITERKKEIIFYYSILTLSFFAMYKYSIARQEGTHSRALLHFMVFFSLVFFIAIKKIKPYMIMIFFAGIMMYYRNLHVNNTYHSDDRIKIIGINNFINMVVDHEEYKNKFSEISKKNLEVNKLPESILRKIGNAKVDFIPWDFSYIYANNLNYKPKPTVQSGALYTPPYLDRINASHIQKSKDLQFILWEKNKWNGEVGGIDDKYLLNEDGGYLYEVFNNYQIVEENDNVLLLERTHTSRLNPAKSIGITSAKWNEWIEVPEISNGYIRAKLEMEKGLRRSLKSAIFKTGVKYVEYLLANGSIIKYRFSDNTIENGMWINPYISEITNQLSGEEVSKIRFTYTDPQYPMKEAITISWEVIYFK